MLIMCRHIFRSRKAVVLNSGFCVTKNIKEIETKGVYVADLIRNQNNWEKVVPCDLINAHFEDKEYGDVGMLEVRTEDNKLLQIFFMKYPDYVMKIKASWMTLDKLEGKKIRRDLT